MTPRFYKSSLLNMSRPWNMRSRARTIAKAFLMVSLVVVTLCPAAMAGTAPAFGAVAIIAGPDMGMMPCPVLSCPSERLSATRHDGLQPIHDLAAQSVAAVVSGMVSGPEPQRASARFLPDGAHPNSFQSVPLYLLHASLIR